MDVLELGLAGKVAIVTGGSEGLGRACVERFAKSGANWNVNLVGDSASTLRLLRPLLKRKQDRGWREKIEKDVADWWKTLEARAMTEAHPINPQRVFWELSPRLPDRAILTCDSGSSANWYAIAACAWRPPWPLRSPSRSRSCSTSSSARSKISGSRRRSSCGSSVRRRRTAS